MPPEEASKSAMKLKGLASNVTVCVGAHARHAVQRVADVDVPLVACLLLGERLEHESENLGQWEKRRETGQMAANRLLRYRADAAVERLRLKRFPANCGGRH